MEVSLDIVKAFDRVWHTAFLLSTISLKLSHLKLQLSNDRCKRFSCNFINEHRLKFAVDRVYFETMTMEV